MPTTTRCPGQNQPSTKAVSAALAALAALLLGGRGNEAEARPAPEADADAAKAAGLAKGLKDKRPAVRMKAAEALGGMGEKAASAAPALVAALFDPSREVRVTAEDALKRVSPALHKPVTRLMKPLPDNDFLNLKAWDAAVAEVGRMGAEGKAAVPALLHYRQELARHRATGAGRDFTAPSARLVAKALLGIAPEDPAVAKVLIAWLHTEPDGSNRAALAGAMPSLKAGKAAVAALAKTLRSDPHAPARKAAAEALGSLGAEAAPAVPALEKAKTDPSPAVREAARDALEKVKG